MSFSHPVEGCDLDDGPAVQGSTSSNFYIFNMDLFSAWLFSLVEQTEMDNLEEKYQLLLSLYNSMASKYNTTIDEFITFSSAVYEALSEPRPQWNYYDAIDFTFQVFTTIG